MPDPIHMWSDSSSPSRFGLTREPWNTSRDLSTRTGIPYQTLINLYLRDCAFEQAKLKLTWKPPKRARSNKRLKLTGAHK